MTNEQTEATIVPAMALRMGDRFTVEPSEGEEFVATLASHYGWGIVHGWIDLRCARENGDEFTYGIHHQTPVRVIDRRG